MSSFGAHVVGGLVMGALLAAVALLVLPHVKTPERLVRVNVSNLRVPALLGVPVVLGGLTAVFGEVGAVGSAFALATVVVAAGGLADDLRGDEAERGFTGHLRAAASGRLTGGLIKILAGGIAGVAAGAIAADGIAIIIEVALLVALGANFMNLLDRAPGRAMKVWLVVALPLFLFGSGGWAIAAAGMLGAVLVCLPADLREVAMLGDAGANPLGAALGLGLAAAFDHPGRIISIVVLLALNLVSERWSFSSLMEATPGLREFDRLGRNR